MRKSISLLAACALLGLGGSAFAEIGTIDDVPAATLLLPYFEVNVDPDVNNGVNTLFSINNASAAAAIAHVTVWTDQSIPTLDFDIYLTGYDVQTINLRDIFVLGNLPRTADHDNDAVQVPPDSLSPSPGPPGPQSVEVDPYTTIFTPGVPTEWSFPAAINTPGGPCVTGNPYPVGVISATRREQLRLAHTGQYASFFAAPQGSANGCLGFDHGDEYIVRGYITVDSVQLCNLQFPSDDDYQNVIADERNILWGDYFYIDEANNFAQGETLVHIESCDTPNSTGSGPGAGVGAPCAAPYSYAAGDYTFYGRYAVPGAPNAGQDQREPLSTTFAARYINGGLFDGGTSYVIWRDSKTKPVGLNGPYNCGLFDGPAWFPLTQTDVVAFNEQEDSEDLCGTQPGGIISPPEPGTSAECMPLEAQKIDIETGNAAADPIAPSFDFGWLYMNLNTPVDGGAGVIPYPLLREDIAQAWVTVIMDANGRFSVGYDAITLNDANDDENILFGDP